MNLPPIYITDEDHAKPSLLLQAIRPPAPPAGAHKLQHELDRAAIVDAKAVPPTIVRMGSRAEIEDLTTGEVEEYALTYPQNADLEKRMLSVLAPIGTAIVGCVEGTEVSWATPGGVRRIRIRRVVPPSRAPARGGFLPAVAWANRP
ncbi:MAG: transcription elongation factor GreAB [Verrucomicrobia bacterium]|nr:transcription elongation factor GreAB [Verrucomicrobiota bacterium]